MVSVEHAITLKVIRQHLKVCFFLHWIVVISDVCQCLHTPVNLNLKIINCQYMYNASVDENCKWKWKFIQPEHHHLYNICIRGITLHQ